MSPYRAPLPAHRSQAPDDDKTRLDAWLAEEEAARAWGVEAFTLLHALLLCVLVVRFVPGRDP